jgi:hypothetical protein
MTTGALIFAHNNAGIDYTRLAVFCGKRVRKYLDLPVSLVTDNVEWLTKNYPDHPFDQIIPVSVEQSQNRLFYDGTLSSKKLEWKNGTRFQAYDVTPYDTTLVLDSDMVICSDKLKSAIHRDVPFQIYKKSFDITGWRDQSPYTRMNPYSIPLYWATVFTFKKDPVVEAFFNLVSYIKKNWFYFRVLYNIDMESFRNDFAFSIAIHIMNGKMNGDFVVELPGKLNFIEDRDILISADGPILKFLLQVKDRLGEYTVAKTENLDVHVINKISLEREIMGDARE